MNVDNIVFAFFFLLDVFTAKITVGVLFARGFTKAAPSLAYHFTWDGSSCTSVAPLL
jgi:hypothetical protein